MSQSPDAKTAVRNSVMLMNASYIVANVIREIAGNDISTSIGGSIATKDVIENITVNKIAKQLEQTV